jgi:hypothetical protein
MPSCSIDGCTRPQKYARTGWCQTHYHRWWRTGDPLGLKQPFGATGADAVGWKGDDISYRAAHRRLQRSRGKATEHSCAECGEPADQWAYDHGDEPKNAVFRGRTVPFSTDINRYQPLCRSCHIKLDRARGKGWPKKAECINGHPFDDVNTYIRPDGERNCRQCSRDRSRKRRELLREQGLSARGRPL